MNQLIHHARHADMVNWHPAESTYTTNNLKTTVQHEELVNVTKSFLERRKKKENSDRCYLASGGLVSSSH